jgi:hypothetical protein
MRRIACFVAVLALAAPHSVPARAQGNLPPHAWLFGSWTGGLFPPPSTVSAQECLSMPVVIFTRDVVMRAVITDQVYTQRVVETARVTPQGVEFRFVSAAPAEVTGPFGLPSGGGGPSAVGFGCSSPNILNVQRRTDNEISFPGCSDFPYPLVRCPAR